MNTYYDVVVVGAGPVGFATACSIKALNPEANICVIDKREDPTRNHGLNIRSDAVRKIQEVLYDTQLFTSADKGFRDHLVEVFDGWSGKFIRTTKIEADLAEKAKQMGIDVFRGKDYEVTESNFNSLFDYNENAQLTDTTRRLQEIFKNALIVVGADGAHSTVRNVVMQNKLVDQEVLRHLVELKYQTEGVAKPRSAFAASSAAVKHGRLEFESMNKASSSNIKPVTLHVFVNETTYNAVRQEDKNGNLKGVFGNSWTLAELKEKSRSDETIRSLYRQLKSHVNQKRSAGFGCYQEKISTLIMNIYRSERCVKEYKGKYVLLVGDAESGIVLEGGFNKGLKGAAVCAKAVGLFTKYTKSVCTHIPDELSEFEDQIQQIFAAERNWAKIKNNVLEKVETTVGGSHSSYVHIREALDSSSSSSSSSSPSCQLL